MQVILAIPLTIAVVAAVCALWDRRESMSLRFDRGFTLTLLLTAGAGVFMVWGLMNPALDGIDLAGCVCLISATAAGANTTAAMILPDLHMRTYTIKMIIAPSASAFVIQLGCVALPDVEWIYWLTLVAVMGYLTGIELYALRVLRREQRHRRVADLYVFAAVTALGAAVACAIRDVLDLPTAQIMVILFAASIVSFARGASVSWENRKRKWLTPPQQRERQV